MSVTFDPFTGPGSTPARRRFWDDAMSLAQASRKLPSTNVKVDEYPSGSVISVPDARNKTQGVATGACCLNGECSITTSAGCDSIHGRFIPGGVCDPNPCCGDCPDPDTESLQVEISGVEGCDQTGIGGPDYTDVDVNGTFMVPRDSSGVWALNYTRSHAGSDFNLLLLVQCPESGIPGLLNIAIIGEDESTFYVGEACAPGPFLSNLTVCPDNAGNLGVGAVVG